MNQKFEIRCQADADALPEHVHGQVDVLSTEDITLTRVKVIYYGLFVDGRVNAPKLEEVRGNVIICRRFEAPALEYVGGYLDICEEAHLPELLAVSGELCTSYPIKLPKLALVGGPLNLNSRVEVPRGLRVRGPLKVEHPSLADNLDGVTFDPGKILAISVYALHYKDGRYTAGCRENLTADEALRHWFEGRVWAPIRAVRFREAIIANEAKIKELAHA